MRKKRLHKDLEFLKEQKKAQRRIKSQHRKNARRARFGERMKPAPVVVRRLDTGDVVPKKRAPKSKTYSRHLNQLARESGYADYAAYLLSPAWKRLRLEVLSRDHWTCQGCGAKANLQVHHDRYCKLDDVLPEWLRTLCRGCHEKAHER